MRKSLLIVLLTFAVAMMLPSAAKADSLTYILNQDGCTGNCLNIANPSAGTVLLTQNGTKVDVLVTLGSSFGFVDNGVAHDSFTFTIQNNPTIVVTGLTSGFAVGTPGSNSPFGAFGVYVNCDAGSPAACGNGASAPYYGSLGFTIGLSSGTLHITDFIGNGNTPSIFFAADVFSNNKNGGTGTGNTGAVGAIGTSHIEIPTPEPASLALLSAGLIGLGSLVRRRK